MKFYQALIIGFSITCLRGLAAEQSDWMRLIRQSQNHLAKAQPDLAAAALNELEYHYPEARKEPLYCYQRFFVALEGLGDRKTSKLMLNRLNALVDTGALAADSGIYLSVTEAWHRALFSSDSDLIRLANLKMKQRLSQQVP